MHDLRSLIELVENRGDLIRINRPVDRKFEMPALMTQVEATGKAYLFENVLDSRFSVVGGLFNQIERVALTMNGEGRQSFTHSDLAVRIEQATVNGMPPETMSAGSCKEVVHTGSEVDLTELPIPTFFELDSGPFITGGIGISRNPESGVLNVGCYRTLVVDKNTVAVNASLLSDLHRFYRDAERQGQKFPVALAIGVDPALLLAAVSKPYAPATEFDVAGAIKGEPIGLITAEMSDLPVPADAEFVIEGEIDFSQNVENVLGEFAGLYGLENAPVMHVKAITHRSDALFYSIMAGNNPEHATLGTIAVYPKRRKLIEKISSLSQDIRAVNAFTDPRFGAMFHVAIAIDKRNGEQPERIIRKAFKLDVGGYAVSQIVRRIIIVDMDVDIDDINDVEWAIWTRCTDVDSMIIFPNAPSWELDRAAGETKGSMRLGIDATLKLSEGDTMVRPRTPGIERIRLEDYASNLNGRPIKY